MISVGPLCEEREKTLASRSGDSTEEQKWSIQRVKKNHTKHQYTTTIGMCFKEDTVLTFTVTLTVGIARCVQFSVQVLTSCPPTCSTAWESEVFPSLSKHEEQTTSCICSTLQQRHKDRLKNKYKDTESSTSLKL